MGKKYEKKVVTSCEYLLHDTVSCDFCRVEKYRPKQLDDLISHKDIISTSEYIPHSI